MPRGPQPRPSVQVHPRKTETLYPLNNGYVRSLKEMGNLASLVRLKRLPADRWVWADTAGKETVGGYYETQATESKSPPSQVPILMDWSWLSGALC